MAPERMTIEVARVPDGGRDYTGSVAPAEVELGIPEAEVTQPVCYDLKAVVVSGELVVSGGLSTTVRFQCSRCAETFESAVEDPSFERVKPAPEGNESVDLTPDMREAIILAFPGYPVCAPRCRGLCAQCGVNLNRGSCSCAPPLDARWHALDSLGVGEDA